MAEPHPVASHHLPAFITAPGETDILMVIMGVILALSVLAFGILFLRLHSLPERMAHRTHKLQLEIVAVLCLIALFTHMHIFWIAALLLAMIDLPDFGTSLNRIAGSAEKIAGIGPGEGAVTQPVEPAPAVAAKPGASAVDAPPSPEAAQPPEDSVAAAPRRPQTVPKKRKEPTHA
jgi:hypothetical protein